MYSINQFLLRWHGHIPRQHCQDYRPHIVKQWSRSSGSASVSANLDSCIWLKRLKQCYSWQTLRGWRGSLGTFRFFFFITLVTLTKVWRICQKWTLQWVLVRYCALLFIMCCWPLTGQGVSRRASVSLYKGEKIQKHHFSSKMSKELKNIHNKKISIYYLHFQFSSERLRLRPQWRRRSSVSARSLKSQTCYTCLVYHQVLVQQNL